jgi:hypothetical protein
VYCLIKAEIYPKINMKSLVCLIFLLSSCLVQAQQKFHVEKGKISFISNAPLEIIKASSDKLDGIIDVSSNQFAFLVQILSFKGFNGELQLEHFNEKYMESDKYPTASFKGKIIDAVDFSKDGEYDVRVKGDLDVHGKTQTRIIKSKIIVKGGKITIETKFTIPLVDHNISIPSIVSEKIATEIEVNINASMSQ